MLGKPCFSQYEMYPISGYFSKLGAHITMLADEERVNAYYEALKLAIIPGKSVVVDIGTGTGILAMMAAKLGAKKVYAIEAGKIGNIAEKLIQDNDLQETISLFQGYSYEMDLPEKADIIVSETMGFTGFEENIVEIFHDAVKRLSKPNVILIPKSVELFLSPVADETVSQKFISFWQRPIKDLDFSRLSSLALNNLYSRQAFNSNGIISKPQVVFTVELGNKEQSNCEGKAEFLFKESSRVSGMAGWFSVDMGFEINLASSPKKEDELGHWQQFFIPLQKTLEVQPKDKLQVTLKMENVDQLVVFSWTVKQMRTNLTIETQSGDVGKLLEALEN